MIKEFIKPDRKKILLGIILIIISVTIENCTGLCLDCGNNYGIPLSFYCSMEGPFNFSQTTGNYFVHALSYLIINICFWYLIACLIVTIYDKYLKKSKKGVK